MNAENPKSPAIPTELKDTIKGLKLPAEIALMVIPTVYAVLYGFSQTDPTARAGILATEGIVAGMGASALIVDKLHRSGKKK